MSLSPETQLRNTILSKVFSLHWTTDFRCASHNHRCIKPGHAGCCYKHLWKDDSGAQWTTAYDCDRMLPVQRVQVWLSPLLHVPLSLLVEQSSAMKSYDHRVGSVDAEGHRGCRLSGNHYRRPNFTWRSESVMKCVSMAIELHQALHHQAQWKPLMDSRAWRCVLWSDQSHVSIGPSDRLIESEFGWWLPGQQYLNIKFSSNSVWPHKWASGRTRACILRRTHL